MTGEIMDLPCGKCLECQKRRISGWSFRLMEEDKFSDFGSFVTLTYNTIHVPITERGFMTLQKSHLQNFFKRLRKLHGRRQKDHITDTGQNRPSFKPIKYYACGEYGTKSDRPHYHIILFNANPFDIARAWALNGVSFGDYHIGAISEASVGYTLKYICKESRIPKHKNDDRLKEFSLMSKGLGSSYLNPDQIQFHKKDFVNRMYVPLKDGKKIAMPRYYKEKIFTRAERVFIGKVQKTRSELALSNQQPISESLAKQILENKEKQRVGLRPKTTL